MGIAVRPPAAAGRFYPESSVRLRECVYRLIGRPEETAPPSALVVPHAGYSYSGAVAAAGFARWRGLSVRRVIVLAPSHFEPFGFASLFEGEAYETPLGRVPVDRPALEALAQTGPPFRFSNRGHWPVPEHAIEVELPFLQLVLGDFQLVPVVLGSTDPALCGAVGEAIARMAGPDTLLVASTDLSHFHPDAEAREIDRTTVQAIVAGDAERFLRQAQRGAVEACGAAAVGALLTCARLLNLGPAELLAQANSTDAGGGQESVVGYACLGLR